jgi:predicted GH43/DUF377 family glycosyl hydrolase
VGDEPIVEADSVPGYGPVFNAGVLRHEGLYHLFARGVRNGYRKGDGSGPAFVDYVSDILVFTSRDGRAYEFAYVLAVAGSDGAYAFEDPRVQWVSSRGDRHLVMTYTNLPEPDSGRPWRIGAHSLRWESNRFRLDSATGRLLGPHGVPDKDAVVFNLADGRVALIHRIHPAMQLAVFDDLDHLWEADANYWDAHLRELASHVLLAPAAGALGVGAGAPPLRTEEGFLLFFHERRADGSYTMNLALLDPLTGRLCVRLPEPVLRPELNWERVGDVNDVVFVQGALLEGDDIYLTYGAADRCVGAAAASVSHLLATLSAHGAASRVA